MLLGDVIRRLEDEAVATETILRLGDLTRLAQIKDRAEAVGLPLGTFVTWTVRHYADTASADEWMTLIGIVSNSTDPGLDFLCRAFDQGVVAAGGARVPTIA